MKKVLTNLFSSSMAGLYIALIALAIAVATFIENDFGTSAAQKLVFRARWFEVLLILFGISLVVNIFRYRMIENKKWAILTFHAAIIIILLGSAITRYFGYEGMMHIREDAFASDFLSAESYLQFEVEKGEDLFLFEKPILFSSVGKNKWNRTLNFGGTDVKLEVLDFIPNPGKNIIDSPEGIPVAKIVMSGANGREEYFISYGENQLLQGVMFNFGATQLPNAINIDYLDGSLEFNAPFDISQMIMATEQSTELEAFKSHKLMLQSMYVNDRTRFVVGEFYPKGKVEVVSTSQKLESNNFGAASIRATVDDQQKSIFISGQKGIEGRPGTLVFEDLILRVAYGSKKIKLPFSIQLHDFIMERYPGTDNPSSYASEVTVHDSGKGKNFDYRIYMNNILNYGGYRFFQSSFDKDEKGTYLSVNHDFWGTWVSYIGYFLLTLGMVFTFFSKKSRFRKLAGKLASLRSGGAASIIIFGILALGNLQTGYSQTEKPGDIYNKITLEHAEQFGRMLVQDHNGRIKPTNTLSSEILRKIARKESIEGLTAEQIFLGMTLFPDDWLNFPFIKMSKHEEIQNIMQTDKSLIAYSDFFDQDQSYKLREHIRMAQSKKPIDRGTFEKDLIKLDERLNICNMIFTGRLLRIFPIPNDPNNTWESPADFLHKHDNNEEMSLARDFLPAYKQTVAEAAETGDWDFASKMITEFNSYQKRIAAHIIPGDNKVNLEIWLNKSRIFSRLGMFYGLLGLLALIFFFASVFNHRLQSNQVRKVFIGLLFAGFIFHTIGLAVRWYISGHAPWSNGYESMIYIAFTTVLAGLIFARKSLGGVAATSFLASIILMVAGLSYLDPEITPLVPVLKSYWLTIHVSLEAGSYGFLMLGAIIGLLNLILLIFISPANRSYIERTVKEMTWISEMTLIAGLVMVSVGTYLGGIWANESWGRYWGWDAKETWALVTILVYAFILHMRFIPGLRGNYAFNVASLFGFASVIMTYFGVNYYLSGLHSYASGDPIPVPMWVYYTAFVFFVVSILAYWRQKRLKKV